MMGQPQPMYYPQPGVPMGAFGQPMAYGQPPMQGFGQPPMQGYG
jgi:hypothetical protein